MHFLITRTKYHDYRSRQVAVEGLLPLGHASGFHDMRSSMFVAYCLAGTDVQDLIAAVA